MSKKLGLKLETYVHNTKEIFLQNGECTVTINPWANLEGVNIQMHGKDLALRMAGAFRWEEIDMLLTGLAASRLTD